MWPRGHSTTSHMTAAESGLRESEEMKAFSIPSIEGWHQACGMGPTFRKRFPILVNSLWTLSQMCLGVSEISYGLLKPVKRR